MASPPKMMHGARAKVAIYDPVIGATRIVGIFNSFSYAVTHDVQPAFILGRFSAAELTTTAVEPVNITAGGWRVVNHGPYIEARLTPLRNLLFQQYLTLTVIDRQTKLNVGTIRGCLPTGYSATLTARQLMEGTHTYLGLLMDDESTQQAEDPTATDLPG